MKCECYKKLAQKLLSDTTLYNTIGRTQLVTPHFQIQDLMQFFSYFTSQRKVNYGKPSIFTPTQSVKFSNNY